MEKQKPPIEQIVEAQERKPRNILFVCGANINRGPTGERIFRKILKERGYRVFDPRDEKTWADYDIKVSSAGTNIFKEDKTNQLERQVADTADLIFTFDERLKCTLIHKFYQPAGKIVDLNIHDNYNIEKKNERYNLKRILRKKLAIYFPLP